MTRYAASPKKESADDSPERINARDFLKGSLTGMETLLAAKISEGVIRKKLPPPSQPLIYKFD